MFFMLVLEGLALYFPMLLQRVTEIIMHSADSANTAGETITSIVLNAVMVFGFIILILIVNVTAEYFMIAFTNKYSANIRSELFNKFQRVSSSTLEKYGQSKVMPVIQNDSHWLRQYKRRVISSIIFIPITIFGSLVMMFLLDVRYSLIALAAVPFIGLFFWIYMRRMKKVIPQSVQAFDDYFINVKEGITGARDIRILGKADERAKQFEKLVYSQRRQAMSADVGINLSISFHAIIFTIITVIIILYGIHFNMQVAQDLVILNTILQYLTRIQTGSHILFTWFVEHMPRIKLCKERIEEVINLPEIAQDKGLTSLPLIAEPRLEIVNVEYAYPNGTNALTGVNINVPHNARIAIAGGVGSGKNMLARIILREKAQTSGDVLFNDIDTTSISVSYLRRHVFSYCGPHARILTGTMRDNLKMFAPNATDEEIMQLFEDMDAIDFTQKFGSNFLDFKLNDRTPLGDGTKNLINIVRMTLKPSYIYVYNQCFEHVRPEYLTGLMQHLKREKKTCLMVTYSGHICRSCNRVYVLKNGKITGEGKHADLMAYNADYKRFYASTLGMIQDEEINYEEKTAQEQNDNKEMAAQGLDELPMFDSSPESKTSHGGVAP